MERMRMDRDAEEYEKRVRPLYAAISKAGPDDSEAMEIIDMLLHHPKINVNIGSYNDVFTNLFFVPLP